MPRLEPDRSIEGVGGCLSNRGQRKFALYANAIDDIAKNTTHATTLVVAAGVELGRKVACAFAVGNDPIRQAAKDTSAKMIAWAKDSLEERSDRYEQAGEWTRRDAARGSNPTFSR